MQPNDQIRCCNLNTQKAAFLELKQETSGWRYNRTQQLKLAGTIYGLDSEPDKLL